MRKQLFAILVLFVVLSMPVSAVWEEVSTDEFLEAGRSALVQDLNLKINSVNAEEEQAEITVKKGNNQIFSGTISSEEGYTKSRAVKIRTAEFDYKYQNPRVRLAVEKWESADVSKTNFPERIYKLDSVKAFVVVENTAERSTTLNVELSSNNTQVKTSTRDAKTRFSSSIRQYKTSASHEISLGPGEKEKVYFEIQPRNREGTISPVIRILSESGQLIKQERIGDIEIVNSQVGYIEDVIVPSGTLSGDSTQIKVKVRNGWMVASNDFYVELVAPEFKLNEQTKRVRVSEKSTEEVIFDATPYGGGDFTVTAELSIGRRLEDTASANIPVVGDLIYKIENVEGPNTMEPGESEPVFVTIRNNGVLRNILSLQLDSKDFAVNTPPAVIRLDGKDSTRVLFNIKPITERAYGSYEVKLYDEPASERVRNEQGRKLIDSTTRNVEIIREEIQQPVEETTEEENDTEEPVNTAPEEENVSEEMEETQEEPQEPGTVFEWNQDWTYGLIGLGVLILIIVIVASVSKKSPDVEVYDLDKTVKKSKKNKRKK